MKKPFEGSLLGAERGAERTRIFRALVLRTMVATSLFMPAIMLVHAPLRGLALQTLLGVDLAALAALELNRRGHTRVGSWVVLLGILAVVTSNAWQAGGLRSPGMGTLLVLPVLTVLLLGDTAALVMTGLCAATVAGLALAEEVGVLPPPTYTFPLLPRVLLYGLYLVIVALVARLLAASTMTLLAQLREELAERRRAEARLELALDAGTIGVFEQDPVTGLARVDRRVFEIFGAQPTPDGVASLADAWSAIHPDDRAVLLENRDAMAGGTGRFHFQFRGIGPDGSERTVQVNAATVAGDASERRVVGIIQDVTERVRGQQERERLLGELSRTEAMLRAVLDSSDDMVWAVDAQDFRIIATNRKMEEHFALNYDVRPVVGMGAVELFPQGEYRGIWQKLFERALREGPFVLEEYQTARGGLLLEVHFGLLRREDEVFGISIYGRNITERHAAEVETRRSQARFRAIFDASPNGVVISRGGSVLLANPAFARMFGIADAEQAKGLSIADCFAPESARLMLARQQARFAGAKLPPAYEVTGLRGDGATFPAYMQLIVFELPDGPAVLAFFEDLTEKRRAEEEQAMVEAQLRHAQQMEAIGTLAAGFAHDFNNVLAPILGATDLALDQIPPDSPVREDLAVIEAAARRARGLVRQILLLSRAEEDTERVAIQPIRLVEETVSLLRAALPSTVEIRTELPERCPPMLGNATQLQQVLLNLCTNARDAMHGTGILTLALRQLGPDDAGCTQEQAADDTWIMLSVSDTGCGMSPEVQRRIFEPYFTTKPRGKGTGLGLSVTNGIIAALGGRIRVRSAPGEGSTFEVLLPASALQEGLEPAVREAPRGHGERVLVIDDEAAFRAVMVRMLSALGYTAAELEEPEAVLALVRSAPDALDAIVMDQTMPGMTGLELATECLTMRPDLPIILCTGDASRADTAGTGIRQVLLKPFRMNVMAEALRSALAPERSVAD